MSESFLSKLIFETKVFLVGSSGAIVLSLLRKTLRLKKVAKGDLARHWSQGDPIVLAFWHSQQLMMPWIYLDSKPAAQRKPIYALISKSKDGRFIAKAMKLLQINSVAGSSSRGGKEALVQLVRLVKSGCHVAITPDGPTGPKHKAKIGALKISQLTGAKIFPAAFASKYYWEFGSWDRMRMPKPFSKAAIVMGEPLIVPREATEEEVVQMAAVLESELNRITTEAEKLVKN